MDSRMRDILLLGAASFAGARAGRWAAPRIGAALGLAVGPWGVTAGAVIGGMLGALLVSKVAGPGSDPMLNHRHI